jgi:hypothetical protein
MIGLILLALNLLAALFKSKSRLEAEECCAQAATGRTTND